ncbi:hypothetical protein D3C80_1710370 [compost metagenome]
MRAEIPAKLISYRKQSTTPALLQPKRQTYRKKLLAYWRTRTSGVILLKLHFSFATRTTDLETATSKSVFFRKNDLFDFDGWKSDQLLP